MMTEEKTASRTSLSPQPPGVPPSVPRWTSARYFTSLMLFLGMANAYVMRTNMSVAIVAMVNQTAILGSAEQFGGIDECPANREPTPNTTTTMSPPTHPNEDGEFLWDAKEQALVLSAFFYGYVVTQIPFGIMAKKYGAKYFLGVGMLINSVFGLLVPVSAKIDFWALIAIRFVQGLGEGPIVPCTHAMLSKWIPPSERSRLGAFVYAGAQFGTVVSLPLSGLLSRYGFAGGWPSIFYVFGAVGTVWSIAFLVMVYEDPRSHPRIREAERKFIIGSSSVNSSEKTPPTPWCSVLTSLPFWAILIAHMGQNYGYETLLTQLPSFMKQILHFDIKQNGYFSALPYLCMWLFSIFASFVADWLIWQQGFTITFARKLLNSIGMFGPGISMIAVSYTGCSDSWTVALLSIGVGLMGGTMSGYRINHLDISPTYAGILMSMTNCVANIFALLAPIIAGQITFERPTQAAWREVFFVSAGVYLSCALFYLIFASGEHQPWDQKSEENTIADPNTPPIFAINNNNAELGLQNSEKSSGRNGSDSLIALPPSALIQMPPSAPR